MIPAAGARTISSVPRAALVDEFVTSYDSRIGERG